METSWSVDAVGDAAGRVWKYLSEKGEASLSALEKGVEAPASLVHMGLGWLAREGKIRVEQERRTVKVSLNNGA